MGKSDSTVRQRAVQKRESDEDVDLLLGTGPSADDKSKRNWLIVIVVLVLLNIPPGYVHFQRFRQYRGGQALQEKNNVLVEEPIVYLSGHVKQMTEETLPDLIASNNKGTLVNFHLPGCRHCKELATEFERAAEKLSRSSINVSLVTIDASAAPLAVKRYNVTKYPTMLWFRKGELLQDLPAATRKSSGIVDFVDQALKTAVIGFPTHQDYDDAVSQLRSVLDKDEASPPVVVGFGKNPGFSEAFALVAEKFRGSTTFIWVMERHKNDPQIRLLFPRGKPDVDFNGAPLFGEILGWLQEAFALNNRTFFRKGRT